MNFRILAASVWPCGRVFALLTATALTATLLAPGAYAQQPAATPAPKAKAKAAPKAAPAAPVPAAQQAAPPAAAGAPAADGQPQDQQVHLIYAPWTKFCIKSQGQAALGPPDANAKQICFIGKDGRIESGQPVIAAVIIEPEGEPKKILRVTLPLGMQLAHGTRIVVDTNPPAQSPFSFCYPNGCVADYELTPELLANMKKGQVLYVQAIPANNDALTLPLPLQEGSNSFAKAYDGPPTDPKVFEENQKKLQEELQKRAEEARKKLEANQPAAGAAPANPAAK
jgi:invasion protein IalB